MKERTRMTNPEDRRAQILTAALELSEAGHYMQVTRKQVADRANVSISLVEHYFGTMTNFRRDIMRAAVRLENVRIIAQGLGAMDAHAQKAPPKVKDAAIRMING